MKAFWDQCGDGQGGVNYGDALTPWLWQKVHGEALTWAPWPLADMVIVGSLLEGVPDGWAGTILGTGFMFERSAATLGNARVLALRGPLTRHRVLLPDGAPAPVLGDLGLLAGAWAPVVARTVPVGVLFHYADPRPTPANGERISLTQPVEAVLEQVARCKRVICSSLHGLILADSIGIPRLWDPWPGVLGDGFKFRDYAGSLDQEIIPGVWQSPPRPKVLEKMNELQHVLRSAG